MTPAGSIQILMGAAIHTKGSCAFDCALGWRWCGGRYVWGGAGRKQIEMGRIEYKERRWKK